MMKTWTEFMRTGKPSMTWPDFREQEKLGRFSNDPFIQTKYLMKIPKLFPRQNAILENYKAK